MTQANALAIRFMYYAMLLPSEVANIRWPDIQQETDDIGRLTGSDRVVQISPKTMNLLHAMSKQHPRAEEAPDDTVPPAE